MFNFSSLTLLLTPLFKLFLSEFLIGTRKHTRLGVDEDDEDDHLHTGENSLALDLDLGLDQEDSDLDLDQDLEVQFNLQGTTGGYSHSYLSELNEKGLNCLDLLNAR